MTYGGDADSLAATMTSCLDPGASVMVAVPVTSAALTSPLPGQANVDPATAFTWSAVPRAQGYYLAIGTTYGGCDLVNSGIVASGQSSFRVTALPAGPLYATLCTEFNGAWLWRVNAFTAGAGEAALTHPTSGQANIDASTPFTWSTVAGAQGYYLVVGTTPGAYDVTNSGILPPGQSSYTVAKLPSGQALYAVILTYVNGSWARFQCLRFTAR